MPTERRLPWHDALAEALFGAASTQLPLPQKPRATVAVFMDVDAATSTSG